MRKEPAAKFCDRTILWFSVRVPSTTPSRTVRPVSANTSSNFRGIAHVASTDQLIVTDFGDSASAVDGKLYVINSVMSVSGAIAPAATILETASLLGNSVDLAFDGSTAYVTEKSNDVW